MENDYDLLMRAGPGHMVIRKRWRERNGSEVSIAYAYPNDVNISIVAADFRAAGWPGHPGSRIDYLVADIWKWLRDHWPAQIARIR